jgi:hypothetical protein
VRIRGETVEMGLVSIPARREHDDDDTVARITVTLTVAVTVTVAARAHRRSTLRTPNDTERPNGVVTGGSLTVRDS